MNKSLLLFLLLFADIQWTVGFHYHRHPSYASRAGSPGVRQGVRRRHQPTWNQPRYRHQHRRHHAQSKVQSPQIFRHDDGLKMIIQGMQNERFHVNLDSRTNQLIVRSLHDGRYVKRWEIPPNVDTAKITTKHTNPGLEILLPYHAAALAVPQAPAAKMIRTVDADNPSSAGSFIDSKFASKNFQQNLQHQYGWIDPVGQLLEDYTAANDNSVRIMDEYFQEDYAKVRGAATGFTDTRGTWHQY